MIVKLGIRREDKPFELRTPIIPDHVGEFIEEHGFDVWVEPSDQRTYSEESYRIKGGMIGPLRGSQVPIIFGIKEIPIVAFEPGKVYLFFAHVIKGQPQNMPMLRHILKIGATLIDYERIIDVKSGRRLVFFGNWAGYAGMAETLRALGQRLAYEKLTPNPFLSLRPTYTYAGLKDLKAAIHQVGEKIRKEGVSLKLTPLVIGFIGYGNTSQGAQAIFDLLPHKEVSPKALKTLKPDPHHLYKVVFREEHTVKPLEQKATFDLQHYYDHGKSKYSSQFSQYLPYLTILMNCIYWSNKYPRLITRLDLRNHWIQMNNQVRLKIVGDISCDIEGAMEFTLECAKPDKPTYVYDPLTEKITPGIKGPGVVIMAVDNLPTELPREASTSFSESIRPYIPAIATADYSASFDQLQLPPEVKKAVIVYNGELTPSYEYLKEYL